jgi:PEGA domain
MGIALSLLSCVPEQPIDPTKPSVNHDRSGLWAPDPLDEFSSEPASISPATRPPAPHKRVSAVRRQEGHRATLAVVEPVAPASTSRDRRGLLSFASGSAFGALMCVILVSWLTTSEQPRAEPFVGGPEPVSPAPAPVASVPAPISPGASEPPPAHRSIPLSREHPALPSTAAKASSATDAKKGSFLGELRIDSTPQGARVFIDRTAAGVTPLVVLDLGAGSHAVRVEADGHLPWSSSIRVITGRQTRVHTTLAPLDSASVRR